MRSKSRHIGVELYQKNDYVKITNNGNIGLQGQIFHGVANLKLVPVLTSRCLNFENFKSENFNCENFRSHTNLYMYKSR